MFEKTSSVIIIIFLYLSIYCRILSADAWPQNLKDKIADLNYLYNQNGFQTRAEMPDAYRSSVAYNRLNRCKTYALGDTNSFSVIYKEDSSVIFSFYNWPIINAINANQPKLHPGKPLPTWTKDKAIKLAKQCALIFFPDMAQSAQVSYVDYSTEEGRVGNLYRDGQWIVYLSRVSKDGYPFRSDFINVQLAESAGPLLAVMRIPSNFPERKYSPITVEQAVIASSKALEQFKKAPYSSMISGPTTEIALVEKPKLEVVNPYDINANSLQSYLDSQGVNATLAWVTDYQFKTPYPPGVGQPGGADVYNVFVFVDAETGRFLGADF